MKIEVNHYDHNSGNFIHVANVHIEKETSVNSALEYAFRWTNNIDGSWSQGELVNWEGTMVDNPDFNRNVEVIAPLPTHLGRTYGLRSSSVNDIFQIGEKSYQVASFGFNEV